MIADSLGLPIDSIDESIEPVIAGETVRVGSLEVPRGHVLGIHQVARGASRGSESICLELEMYIGAPEPSDTITINGVPDLKLVIPGGIHGDLATVAVVVNCIPALFGAKPGLRTSREIPMCFFDGSLLSISAR
jgi:4-hydroxy-tetrahydrodipicolinate reductase